jgi:hypothetical protein
MPDIMLMLNCLSQSVDKTTPPGFDLVPTLSPPSQRFTHQDNGREIRQ